MDVTMVMVMVNPRKAVTLLLASAVLFAWWSGGLSLPPFDSDSSALSVDSDGVHRNLLFLRAQAADPKTVNLKSNFALQESYAPPLSAEQPYSPVCRLNAWRKPCVNPFFPDPKTVACTKEKATPSSTGAWVLPEGYVYNFDQPLTNAIIDNVFVGGGSVLELGSGLGCYIHYFRSSGKFSRVTGIEGASNVGELTKGYVDQADLTEKQEFGQFDWVMSLEVAEHIPPEHETTFVANLVGSSPKGIVLSWAFPGQGGVGHYNERSQEYVISLMKEHGYYYDEEKTQIIRSHAASPWLTRTPMVFYKAS
jgi:hypothetical protein